MPMSFSLTQMILISAAYLLVLFGVAWISERGMIPRAIIRHPLTYTLSLGVYASAWAFYGTVGLAYEYGYGFYPVTWGFRGVSAGTGAALSHSENHPYLSAVVTG
jgi:hypothetical protein